MCDIINQETTLRERIIYQNRYFLALAPFAARFPFETWIIPKVHSSDYTKASNEELQFLAKALSSILWALKETLNDPPDGKQLRRRAEDFSAERIVDKYLELFNRKA